MKGIKLNPSRVKATQVGKRELSTTGLGASFWGSTIRNPEAWQTQSLRRNGVEFLWCFTQWGQLAQEPASLGRNHVSPPSRSRTFSWMLPNCIKCVNEFHYLCIFQEIKTHAYLHRWWNQLPHIPTLNLLKMFNEIEIEEYCHYTLIEIYLSLKAQVLVGLEPFLKTKGKEKRKTMQRYLPPVLFNIQEVLKRWDVCYECT